MLSHIRPQNTAFSVIYIGVQRQYFAGINRIVQFLRAFRGNNIVLNAYQNHGGNLCFRRIIRYLQRFCQVLLRRGQADRTGIQVTVRLFTDGVKYAYAAL